MRGVSFAVVLLTAVAAHAEGSRSPDVLTLVNGNLYHGAPVSEVLGLKAAYGDLDLPVARLAALRRIGPGLARLETVEGERFTGRLAGERLLFQRVGEPRLDLAAADIAEIVFAPRADRPVPADGPDLVETRGGDLFRGRIQPESIDLRVGGAPKTLARGDLRVLLVEGGGKEPLRAHVFLAETNLIGEPAEAGLGFVPRSGATLSLPLAEVAALGFGTLPAKETTKGLLPSSPHRPPGPVERLRDRLRDGGPGPEMVVLKGGSYMRGDLQGDGDFDEKPAKPVTIPPFAIGAHPVTFAEYDRFCEATGRPKADDRGFGRGNMPAFNVSWDEAMEYVRWLSGQTGKHYRLPSDAEWEFAARGGTGSRFWWGDEPRKGLADCGECGSLWSGEAPARVGRFPANGFGLHDMTGNVWQWVADCWNNTFVSAPADGSAMDKGECNKRVIRGGAWSTVMVELRSANRWREFPQRHGDDTGFRLARDLDR